MQEIASIVTQTRLQKEFFVQKLQLKKIKKRNQLVAATGITRHCRENDARLSPVLLLSHMLVHL